MICMQSLYDGIEWDSVVLRFAFDGLDASDDGPEGVRGFNREPQEQGIFDMSRRAPDEEIVVASISVQQHRERRKQHLEGRRLRLVRLLSCILFVSIIEQRDFEQRDSGLGV